MRQLVRQYVTDGARPGSLSGRARASRWSEFTARFPDLSAMRVLDLGGVPAQWTSRPDRPAAVVVLNLEMSTDPAPSWLRAVRGDACDLPGELRGERFDLVFSNSVLEHVGGHARRAAFADTVRAAAPHHWVQTPYRYFPVEPHWLLPGFQFLPVPARAELSRRWPYGHIRSADRAAALADVTSVELIGRTELAGYFPGSEIWAERFGGLVKSLVAVR
jgi:hypothetical protein